MLNVNCSYKRNQKTYHYTLNLSNEILGIMGYSGSGKTTMLDILSGLTTPDSGKIVFENTTWFCGESGQCLSTEHRHVGYVFQESGLFPHLTVKDNVMFGPVCRGIDSEKYASELLAMMGIKHLENTKPLRLSGGEKRRVAIARALCVKPKLLLLDEPMTGIDEENQRLILSEIKTIHKTFKLPIILVTHNAMVANEICDRVLQLSSGQLVEN